MQPALALGLGMVERSQTAGRSPRVMLLSDGLASETPDVLRAEAARAARGEFPLSTLGIGSDFDESLMSSLADTGAGNYYYLRDPGQLAEILDDEFATARATVASGLAVTLAPGDGVEVIDAAGYPLERDRRGVTFRPGTLFAGQQRRIWVTLRVPTDLAVERSLGDVALRFDEAGVPRRIELPDLPRIATVETEQQFLSGLDGERWADAVAVEEWGDLRQKVGRYVQQGRRDAALSAIDAFQARIAPLQTAHPEPEVARKLEDASALEASVAEVFDAPDAPAARNRLGKDLHAQSTLDRRVGDRI
jgi:Ca-activated chloride channel family protein